MVEDPGYGRGIGEVYLASLASAASINDATDSPVEIPDGGTGIARPGKKIVVHTDNNPLQNVVATAVDIDTYNAADLVADSLSQRRASAPLSYHMW